MKHLLSIEKLARADTERILAEALTMKRERGRPVRQPLAGQIWAMLFAKSSTRTRVSFEVGIRELGGQAIFFQPVKCRPDGENPSKTPPGAGPFGPWRCDPHVRAK